MKPRKKKRQDDVLELQYQCVSLKKENLILKKRKLELQVQLFKGQVNEMN